ncbi:restriction endonuclease subunit S [Acinetobacter towneri]
MATPKLRFDGFSGNWVTTQLGNVCSFTQGVQIPQSEQINEERDGYIRYLYIRDFFSDKFKCYVPNIYPEKIIHPHEIMMVNTGNTTGEAYTGRYGVLSNNSFKISYDLAHFNDQFMYLFCSSELAQNQIKKFFNAGGQPHLGHKNISQILISYPKKEEQTKIASFLCAVDEKISQLTQKHALLSQYKQGMMQKLFSQQLRFKADDGSEFGEWEDKTISEIASYRRGSFPQPYGLPEWLDENGFPFVQVYDVADNMLLKDKTKIKISQLAANQSVLAKAGTLIITLQGSIGRVAKMQYDAYVDRTLLIFQSYAMPIDTDYFKYALYLLFNIEKEKADGGIIKTITKETLSKFNIGIPCLEEQTKIANFLSAIDQKIEVVAQQIEQAKQWKKGLLQQMFV